MIIFYSNCFAYNIICNKRSCINLHKFRALDNVPVLQIRKCQYIVIAFSQYTSRGSSITSFLKTLTTFCANQIQVSLFKWVGTVPVGLACQRNTVRWRPLGNLEVPGRVMGLQRRPAAHELETPSGNSVWSPPDSAGFVLTVNIRQKQWLQNLPGYLYPFTSHDCDLSDDENLRVQKYVEVKVEEIILDRRGHNCSE